MEIRRIIRTFAKRFKTRNAAYPVTLHLAPLAKVTSCYHAVEATSFLGLCCKGIRHVCRRIGSEETEGGLDEIL
jgi:hypothetical protein